MFSGEFGEVRTPYAEFSHTRRPDNPRESKCLQEVEATCIDYVRWCHEPPPMPPSDPNDLRSPNQYEVQRQMKPWLEKYIVGDDFQLRDGSGNWHPGRIRLSPDLAAYYVRIDKGQRLTYFSDLKRIDGDSNPLIAHIRVKCGIHMWLRFGQKRQRNEFVRNMQILHMTNKPATPRKQLGQTRAATARGPGDTNAQEELIDFRPPCCTADCATPQNTTEN